MKRIQKTTIRLFLLVAILIATRAWSNTLYSVATKMKNLSTIDYPGKAELTADIQKLLQGKEDIYSLSIPLIASAQPLKQRLVDSMLN